MDFIVESSIGDGGPEGVGIGRLILTAIALLTQRFRQRGVRSFLGVATVLLVLSFISPFQAAETIETAVSLSLMHIAAAMGIVGALAREMAAALRLSA